jgi:hypothetical protein
MSVDGTQSRRVRADGELLPSGAGNEAQGRKALTFIGLFQSDEGFYGNSIRSPFSATEQLDGRGQCSPSLAGAIAPPPASPDFASHDRTRGNGPSGQGEVVG